VNESRGTILVVDDEESIRDIVSRRLEEEGYQCTTASDGKEALWKSFMHDFDLVLTDIKMPGMSGLEVLSQIANDHPDTGVVMITALAETKTAVEAMKIGAFDYVTKPFNLDDLVMRVERALDRRRLVLENREYRLQLEQKVERQVGQIRQYYQEAIEALAREETVLEELNTLRNSENRDTSSQSMSAGGPREPSSPVKGFAKRLSHLIGAGSTDSLVEEIAGESAQAEAAVDEVEGSVSHSQEGQEGSGLSLYEGTTELAIVPPVTLHRMLLLHEHLRALPQTQVLNLGGSVDKGITIRVVLERPTPLVMVLRNLPEVGRATDESLEAVRMVPARESENPPVRRIVVELIEKTTEATNSTPDLV
jgi:DNA-binding response OmpR family regulator